MPNWTVRKRYCTQWTSLYAMIIVIIGHKFWLRFIMDCGQEERSFIDSRSSLRMLTIIYWFMQRELAHCAKCHVFDLEINSCYSCSVQRRDQFVFNSQLFQTIWRMVIVALGVENDWSFLTIHFAEIPILLLANLNQWRRCVRRRQIYVRNNWMSVHHATHYALGWMFIRTIRHHTGYNLQLKSTCVGLHLSR